MTLDKLVRKKCAKQKSITFYEDQMDIAEELLQGNTKAFQDLVRKGLDLVLEQIEKEGK